MFFHGSQTLQPGMEIGSVSTCNEVLGQFHLIPAVRALAEGRGQQWIFFQGRGNALAEHQ